MNGKRKYFYGSDLVYCNTKEWKYWNNGDQNNNFNLNTEDDFNHEIGLISSIRELFEVSDHFILTGNLKIGIKTGITKKVSSTCTNTSLREERKHDHLHLNTFYELNFMLGYMF